MNKNSKMFFNFNFKKWITKPLSEKKRKKEFSWVVAFSILAIVISASFQQHFIFADQTDVIYTDPNGNEYKEEDLVTYNDGEDKTAKFDISKEQTGDLWGNVFISKENPEEYLLVLTGTGTTLYTDYNFSLNYLIPSDIKSKIKRAVISKEFNPDSWYKLLCNLSAIEEVSIEVNEGEKKTPTNLEDVFYYLSVESIDLSNIDPSNCKKFKSILNGCTKLKDVNINSWSNVPSDADWSSAFNGLLVLEKIDLSTITVPGNKTLFGGDNNLKVIMLPNITGKLSPYSLDGTNTNQWHYFHYDAETDKYTQLKINGKSNANDIGVISMFYRPFIIPKGTKTSDTLYLDGPPDITNISVTTMDDQPTNLVINCLKWITKPTLDTDTPVSITSKTYKTGDDIEIKIKYNTDLSSPWTVPLEEETELLFTATGEGVTIGTDNNCVASLKRIDDDTLIFSYTVKEGEVILEGTSVTFTFNKITNTKNIVSKVDYNEITEIDTLDPLLTLDKTDIIIDTTPEVVPTRKRNKKVEEVKDKVEEQVKEENESSLKTSKKPIMVGYEDKTFKPNEKVTRAESATLFARLFDNYNENEDYTKSLTTYIDFFEDWYTNSVGFCFDNGLLTGYEDNTFRANEGLKRGELASILAKLVSINDSKQDKDSLKENNLTDLEGKWYADDVNKLVSLGILKGFDDGEFKGEEYVRRCEIAIILNRLSGRTLDNIPEEAINEVKSDFTDLDSNDWYFKEIALATLDLSDSSFEGNITDKAEEDK